MLQSVSLSKQFEFLALDLEVSKNLHNSVIGCYTTPSAVSGTLLSLMQLISEYISTETIITGDLNWNWLDPVSDDVKAYCGSLNLFQIVNSPTRPNLTCPEKSSLIDLILTNAPCKYTVTQ